jgi:hypothetical protein
VPSATSGFRPVGQFRRAAECSRFAQDFVGQRSPGDRTGERPTLPSSGRAMRESDHVAHPQTSGDRAGASVRGVPVDCTETEGLRLRHPMCSSRSFGRTRIWWNPGQDPSGKKRRHGEHCDSRFGRIARSLLAALTNDLFVPASIGEQRVGTAARRAPATTAGTRSWPARRLSCEACQTYLNNSGARSRRYRLHTRQ